MWRATWRIVLALVCAHSLAAAGVWTVHNDGTTTDPFGTLLGECSLKTLIEDPSYLQPGDMVIVESGTYVARQIWWPFGKAGLPDQPIIIRGAGDPADPNTFPLFSFPGPGCDDYWMRFRDNAFIIVEKLRVDHMSRPILFDTDPLWNGAHDLTFRNLVITWAGIPGSGAGRGIEFQEPSADYVGWMPQYNIVIQNVTIRHVGEVGIQCHGRAHDIKIENVVIDDVDNGQDDTTGDGITFTTDKWGAPANITLSNVTVSNVRADGIDIKAYGNITLRDCRVFRCGANGIKLWAPNVRGWFAQATFKLRDVQVYDVGQVGCEAFHMPNLDMERCRFSGAEQGFLYKWWADGDDPDHVVPWWGWTATLRSYRNAFATTSMGYPACEIVTRHVMNNNAAYVLVDPNSINNDAFWRWSPRPDDWTLDPNDCAPSEWDPAGYALMVYEYGQGGGDRAATLADVAAGSLFGKFGLERSGVIRKSTPPYSPAADYNGDGAVDGLDFLVWQTGFPRIAGATKRTGDGTADGGVDGLDFLCWQSWFPYRTGDVDRSGATDPNDYFIWLDHYIAEDGNALTQGDADGNGTIDYADFLVWQAEMRPSPYSPPADFNRDGCVDSRDWLIWQTNFGNWPGGGATKANGDANGDGLVDGLDLGQWQRWNPYPPVRKAEPDGPPIDPPHP